MIESIQQGDQYYIPVNITVNGLKPIPGLPGPSDTTHVHVDGIRVQLGGFLKSSGDADGVIYDSEADEWLYPLTEYESRRIGTGRVERQIAVWMGNSIIHSTTDTVQVDRSLITEAWNYEL